MELMEDRKPKSQETTELEPRALREAQVRSGLSDTQASARLHVSDTTWKRWRKTGKVPTTAIPAVSRVLGLPELLRHFDPASPNGEDGLKREVAELRRMLEEALRERD